MLCNIELIDLRSSWYVYKVTETEKPMKWMRFIQQTERCRSLLSRFPHSPSGLPAGTDFRTNPPGPATLIVNEQPGALVANGVRVAEVLFIGL